MSFQGCSIEYTDTFGGEANYSWVKRDHFALNDKSSNAAFKREAKRRVGLSCVRGTWDDFDGDLRFTPRGMNTVLFLTWGIEQ